MQQVSVHIVKSEGDQLLGIARLNRESGKMTKGSTRLPQAVLDTAARTFRLASAKGCELQDGMRVLRFAVDNP